MQTMFEPTTTHGTQNGAPRISVHQVQNLIAVIIAEAQLLRLDVPEDDPSYESTVAIERAGRQLEALVDEMADAEEGIGQETSPSSRVRRPRPASLGQETLPNTIEGIEAMEG